MRHFRRADIGIITDRFQSNKLFFPEALPPVQRQIFYIPFSRGCQRAAGDHQRLLRFPLFCAVAAFSRFGADGEGASPFFGKHGNGVMRDSEFWPSSMPPPPPTRHAFLLQAFCHHHRGTEARRLSRIFFFFWEISDRTGRGFRPFGYRTMKLQGLRTGTCQVIYKPHCALMTAHG